MSCSPSTPIPVAVLGATSPLGQHLVARLTSHPWFKLVAVAETGVLPGARTTPHWPLPASGAPVSFSSLPLVPCDPAAFPGVKVVFSALSAPAASKVEAACAEAGMAVLSTGGHERLSPDVPMLLPEVNPEHTTAIPLQRKQRGWLGCLVSNASPLATSLALALKPLDDAFGLEQVLLTPLLGVSGKDVARAPDLERPDDTFPFLPGEKQSLARETRRLLGAFDGELGFLPSPVRICLPRKRKALSDEHAFWVRVKLACQASREDVLVAWDLGRAQRKDLGLPSASSRSLLYHPPTLLSRETNQNIPVIISHLCACSSLDFTFAVVGHGTMSSVAGRSLLQAEYLLRKGYLDNLDWPKARYTRRRATCRRLHTGTCASIWKRNGS